MVFASNGEYSVGSFILLTTWFTSSSDHGYYLDQLVIQSVTLTCMV